MARTKIVCTIGPASRGEDVLRDMIRAGMDVARINFSHGNEVEHGQDIALTRRLSQEEGQAVAIIADLQGPKFRVGQVQGDEVSLEQGQQVTLTSRSVPGSRQEVNLPHPELIRDMQPGNRILLDDGLLELSVERVTETDAVCQVITGGPLKSHKGVSLVGARLSLPAVTEKDRQDLAFAVGQGVDYIAQSFVRRAEDVLELRRAMQGLGASIPIISKIEKAEALECFEEILAVSEGVMVARGDLGVETSVEEVPTQQKRIIRATNRAAKPVITATQMLESMTWNPRPTRAEASDVANAVWDGTDAVMLSEETAVGKYPLEVVRMMNRIAEAAENAFPFEVWLHEALRQKADSVTEAISQATCEMAFELGVVAIISPTLTGLTARAVSHHRPKMPILALTANARTYRQLALVWGVQPCLIEAFKDTDEMLERSIEQARRSGLARSGDLVAITAGVPVNIAGTTNMIQVRTVP